MGDMYYADDEKSTTLLESVHINMPVGIASPATENYTQGKIESGRSYMLMASGDALDFAYDLIRAVMETKRNAR